MNEHIVIGEGVQWGTTVPLSLSSEDRRHHLYVIGKSGTGKSTLLENLIAQDIATGRGFALIDPHGGVADNVLDLIPKNRADDVVYFDPADADFPIGFNVVSNVPPEQRPLAASGIVSVFKNLWPDSWGPRLEYILYACVAALLDCQNVSLLGIPRMLSDERYRAFVIRQIKDPMVRSFWVNEFEEYDRRYRQEAIAPIQNKVGQLFMSPHLRNVLGQVRSKIGARFMMDEGRIFIAKLSKGKIGEDKANLIGALLVSQFQLAAMARSDTPEDKRRDFHLYVDEFQSFASDSFISILSEARKYRLCLTLAHQYTDQLRPGIRDAVFGNVGSLVAFRVGYVDAEVLENSFGKDFPAERFTSLSNREIYAKLLVNGQDREPILGRTLPPTGMQHQRREKLIQLSCAKYSTPREKVERRIRDWLGD